MGLISLGPVSTGSEGLQADLVAVHGLGGDPIKTWTHTKTQAFWLKDFLPLDFLGARIFTFGYNADVAFGNTTADIVDHAKDLLGSLIDQRESDEESQRPIIFIAHSLGGIIVKKALLQACIEAQYNCINEKVAGIIFLGTPHRGSTKADYGKILANTVALASNRPPSRLISALQVNSDSLLRLTLDFKHQFPTYKICSFYETKPIRPLSSLIVEKSSALLEVNGEDQVPVDANHSDMCKFKTRDDVVYEMLIKRINRILKAKNKPLIESMDNTMLKNKYYNIPYNVSSTFTGRDGICQRLQETCLLSSGALALTGQKRFVLYGLGGSGKTQICLKFAQDNREKFWGIFWIDGSSSQTIEQGYKEIGRTCGLEYDVKSLQRWLSSVENPWLLIIDNADDPLLDISQYFPTGGRGTILLTTRNPDCRIHATVGSVELDQMELDEAVLLLLRTAVVENTSAASEHLARSIVQTLGCLALAIVQAGAVLRQKLCTMQDYCSEYARQRQQLLSYQPVQASSDYRFTVYTTWEISVGMIRKLSNKTASNALELLQFFPFLHFDGISEQILKEAWVNMQGQEPSKWTQHFGVLLDSDSNGWNPYPFREAITLLSSFSLIKIDGINGQISMHPLVCLWARDRLVDKDYSNLWAQAATILAKSISWKFRSSDYRFRRLLVPHIDSCLQSYPKELASKSNTESFILRTAKNFALAYAENGRYQDATMLREQALGIRKRVLGDDDPKTLTSISSLANSYSQLGRWQDAIKLDKQVLEKRKKLLGDEHPDTLISISNLASSYSSLGRWQDAIKLEEQVLEKRKKLLGDDHPDTLNSMNNLARSYTEFGRWQDTIKLDEQVLGKRKKLLGDDHPDTLRSINNLANSYSDFGRWQDAIELGEQVLEMSKRVLGDEHPDTLWYTNNLNEMIYASRNGSSELPEQDSDSKDRENLLKSQSRFKSWIRKQRWALSKDREAR